MKKMICVLITVMLVISGMTVCFAVSTPDSVIDYSSVYRDSKADVIDSEIGMLVDKSHDVSEYPLELFLPFGVTDMRVIPCFNDSVGKHHIFFLYIESKGIDHMVNIMQQIDNAQIDGVVYIGAGVRWYLDADLSTQPTDPTDVPEENASVPASTNASEPDSSVQTTIAPGKSASIDSPASSDSGKSGGFSGGVNAGKSGGVGNGAIQTGDSWLSVMLLTLLIAVCLFGFYRHKISE